MLDASRPELARAAIVSSTSHPQATACKVLDLVMRGAGGSLANFKDCSLSGSDFGLIIAVAFDPGTYPDGWLIVTNRDISPQHR
jgi:hypothetical protein